MGREIKFRAWLKEEKRMLDKVALTWPGSEMIIQWYDSLEDYYAGALTDCGEQDAEVMQYTGLKDVEETEIYDGHLCTDDGVSVLQVLWLDSHHQWGVKVISGSGTLSIGLEFPLWHWDNCKQNGYRQLKIIGDIYTNPELLEV